MGNYKKNYTRGIYEGNNVIKTVISMYEVGKDTIITREVKGDHLEKSETELEILLLEQFYQDVYPNRAENERFDKMDKVIKEANEVLDTTRKALASNGMVAFENQSELEDVQAKLEFLAKHLNIKYPSEVTNNEEETNGESTDV